jgi:hypothetical protein
MPDPHHDLRQQLDERAANVRKQHAAAVRGQRRTGQAKNLAIAGLSLGLAWSTYNNNRLAQLAATRDTVYAAIQADGEVITSTHYADVAPAAKQEEAVQNALWSYVQARDCYGSSSFTRQAYLAQAMSEERVARQVKASFVLSNPQAPQHTYGEKGVTVQCELVDPPTPIGDDGNQYLFRFRRWEDDGRTGNGSMGTAPVYSVTTRYRTGIYPADDKRRAWLDRATFNAPGVQVLDYPGAKPENARPLTRNARTAAIEARP